MQHACTTYDTHLTSLLQQILIGAASLDLTDMSFCSHVRHPDAYLPFLSYVWLRLTITPVLEIQRSLQRHGYLTLVCWPIFRHKGLGFSLQQDLYAVPFSVADILYSNHHARLLEQIARSALQLPAASVDRSIALARAKQPLSKTQGLTERDTVNH